jgi:integrase
MAKRRGHGEGSIHLRDDGRWCAVIDLGIINGKRKRKYIYGETRKAVQEQLRALQREQEAGVRLDAARQSLKQFLEYWLEQSVVPQRRPKTIHSYRQIVRLYLIPTLGSHQLSALTPAHVQLMLNQLRASGSEDGGPLSTRTIQYVHAVLRRALGRALKLGLVARNVALLADVPQVETHEIIPLSPAQANALLAAVKGHRLEVLYRVALSLGLRKGEIIGLRWSDIDFEARTLRIVQTVQRISGELIADGPKSKQSKRLLAIPDVLIAALQQHRERQDEEREAMGDLWQDHDLVFPSEVGTPLEPRNLSRHFKSVLRKAELPESTRFHDLRHSCATMLIAQGVHPRVVMEYLGHSQIAITMNTYGHVLPESQREAAAKIDELLRAHQEQQEDDPQP